MSRPLTGKTALVTGGSRSIGAAIAKRLAADGANVALTYSASPQKAADVVAEIEASGGRAIAIEADAGNPEAVRAAVARTEETFGALDILVNNAGIAINGPIEEIGFADYERMIAVNVTGVFVASQEAARRMKSGGRIIQIASSVVQYGGFPTISLYTLTKAAITGFSRALARDLGPKGITVNTVHPGPTDTDMNPDGGPVSAIVGPGIPLGRYGKDHEIAALVAWLASPEASFVNGAGLLADGGFTV
ncbi:3-oxoacyl-ACP reductase family protein [Rhizobium sp. GCM10022189]|jgi:NAD(P)-dependent dehydrogenase (short-subunit alcohol dehydrogenase family)|uniref:3-oxoacyl-ACP reductase family protein n=1 Tax=Rhizobium sp. GCM10022189 TaxID=3252654 RepID=UPI000DD689D8